MSTIAFAMCGSFCTFAPVLQQAAALAAAGHRLLPIMSANAALTDTRFGTAASIRSQLAAIAGVSPAEVITAISGAEPLGPKRMADVLLIAPATGNTLGKLAAGITDTPVAMAAKSMLRIGRPVVVALSTNDGLGASFASIARLMNTKHYYFVPFGQDDPASKPTGLQADFARMGPAVAAALAGVQLQPVLLGAPGA